MALTRILNNQVTDSSAGNTYLGINAGTKIQDYSVTAGKLANNITYASNLTVQGNLDVQGSTTTIDTYNVVIEDPLLLLAKDQSGAPAYDIGYIGERGSSTNIAFAWIEGDDEFATIFTNTAVSNTTVNVVSYANFHTFDANVAGNLTVIGTSDLTGNLTSANISATGEITATGNIDGNNINATNDVTCEHLYTTGNAYIGGNLIVSGNLSYQNVEDLRIEDPIIILGTGANGAPPSTDDGQDRGLFMEYYTSAWGNAFMGWDRSTANMIIANSVTFSANNVVSVTEYGTLQAGNAYLQTAVATGIIRSGSEVLGATLHSQGVANIAGTLQVGSNTTVTNAAITVNTTNSIKIPVGNTLQRPGTGVTGMIRFNTTTDSLEYYDNDSWTSAGTTFTVVVADSFVGNGVANTFTLSQDATTAGTIVSINGIVQIPTTSYSVSGNVLTFTEAPEVSDVIDARLLTTTTQVTALASGSATFEGDGSNAFVLTGNFLNGNANGAGNIGSPSGYFDTIFATATSAQYADLAEMYEADQIIEPGTVVCFGGAKEVTMCATDACRRIAGVISTNPSYIMNAGLAGDHVVAVALTGRVPTRVTGTIRKGDMLVATADGRARAEADPVTGSIIGKALADFDGADGVIEVVVGRL